MISVILMGTYRYNTNVIDKGRIKSTSHPRTMKCGKPPATRFSLRGALFTGSALQQRMLRETSDRIRISGSAL